MSESTQSHHPLSVEEYLELEKTSTIRHEYVGGEIHAMTGASRRHNMITGKIYRRLADAAEGGPCRVYSETVKLNIGDDPFYYPDVMVTCGDVPEDEYFEDAPCVLVEVVSQSTQNTDRREKLAAYKAVPSLRAYLIVAQDQKWITHYFRDESGAWQRGDLTGEGRIPLPCPPGAELTLDDIYRGIEVAS